MDDEAYEHVPATVSQSIGSLLTGIYKLDAALLLVLDPELAVSVAA